MTPTTNQIKEALRILAQRKGRPDYELCTAKQVKYAMDNGLEHHLIAELPFFEIKKPEVKEEPLRDVVPRRYPTEAQAFEIVTWLKNFNGLYKDLAKMVGCNSSMLIHLKTRRSRCTLDMYNRIMKARKKLEGVAA
ncbi:hypothetical protein [Acinetobacter sp. ANC5681]|uniref:hypothetical protein n=1 Tax=Acinetobacter sp. ANC5681 TaxID=2929504 RepID=UPI00201A3F8E|nr:hypothetical protein [Acinetobacter sp. ANC5681]MCL5767380.1 hypothetical protein [Acinetobacter sp. ANC5681]